MCTVGVRGTCALERLQAKDLPEIGADSLGEELKALRRHINACEAEFQRQLHRFDKGEGYSVEGSLSAKAWLRWNCRLTPFSASDRVEVARRLPALELVAKALKQGDISYEHASLIARTAERLGSKFEGPAEEILVTAAKEVDPVRLSCATIQLRHCVEPDGVLEDSNDVHKRRFLHLSQTFEGVFRLDGQLDADGGAVLRTAIDALMTPPVADDKRCPAERRADALVELARQRLDSGELPEVGGQKPHLVVNVEMATLAREPGSPAAELECSSQFPPRTRGVWPATVPLHRSPAARRSGRRGWCRAPCEGRWWQETRAAGSRVATGRRRGRMRITFGIGPMAARPGCPTSSCSAAGTIDSCTKAGGGWCARATTCCRRSHRKGRA